MSILNQKLFRHIALPLIAPAALVCLYFTPKTVFGCANRGFMALGIAFIAMLAAIVTAEKGVYEKRRGEREAAKWWFLTALILFFPFVLILGPLG